MSSLSLHRVPVWRRPWTRNDAGWRPATHISCMCSALRWCRGTVLQNMAVLLNVAHFRVSCHRFKLWNLPSVPVWLLQPQTWGSAQFNWASGLTGTTGMLLPLWVNVHQIPCFQFHQLTMSGCRVFIGHLSPHARERDVEKFFKGYGRIREINLKNGFGFVVSLWPFVRCRLCTSPAV